MNLPHEYQLIYLKSKIIPVPKILSPSSRLYFNTWPLLAQQYHYIPNFNIPLYQLIDLINLTRSLIEIQNVSTFKQEKSKKEFIQPSFIQTIIFQIIKLSDSVLQKCFFDLFQTLCNYSLYLTITLNILNKCLQLHSIQNESFSLIYSLRKKTYFSRIYSSLVSNSVIDCFHQISQQNSLKILKLFSELNFMLPSFLVDSISTNLSLLIRSYDVFFLIFFLVLMQNLVLDF
jgi:hypothetical protein